MYGIQFKKHYISNDYEIRIVEAYFCTYQILGIPVLQTYYNGLTTGMAKLHASTGIDYFYTNPLLF